MGSTTRRLDGRMPALAKDAQRDVLPGRVRRELVRTACDGRTSRLARYDDQLRTLAADHQTFGEPGLLRMESRDGEQLSNRNAARLRCELQPCPGRLHVRRGDQRDVRLGADGGDVPPGRGCGVRAAALRRRRRRRVRQGSGVASASAVFTPAHDFAVVHGKPLFIAEVGVEELPGAPAAKAEWITDATGAVPAMGRGRRDVDESGQSAARASATGSIRRARRSTRSARSAAPRTSPPPEVPGPGGGHHAPHPGALECRAAGDIVAGWGSFSWLEHSHHPSVFWLVEDSINAGRCGCSTPRARRSGSCDCRERRTSTGRIGDLNWLSGTDELYVHIGGNLLNRDGRRPLPVIYACPSPTSRRPVRRSPRTSWSRVARPVHRRQDADGRERDDEVPVFQLLRRSRRRGVDLAQRVSATISGKPIAATTTADGTLLMVKTGRQALIWPRNGNVEATFEAASRRRARPRESAPARRWRRPLTPCGPSRRVSQPGLWRTTRTS